MKEITIAYPKLKTSIIQVLGFTQDYLNEQENIRLRTAIGEDLSLWELDGYDYLDKFQEKFGLVLPDRAYNYVCPPDLKMNILQKILVTCTYTLTLPFFALAYPFLRSERSESTKKKIRQNSIRLTLGDLAASLAIGEFVKREDYKIILKR